jgi:hypothetical protein
VTTDIELLALYTAEKKAYHEYVAYRRGDTVVSTQRISERKVSELRFAWLDALDKLRAAGGTQEAIADLLQAIGRKAAAEGTVKRAT